MKPETNIERAEAGVAADVFYTYVPIEDNLLELPPTKATLAKFPPGAPVLYTNLSIDPLEVSRGLVESVFIDLSPENSSRDYFYKVSFEKKNEPIIAGETQLQWAPSATVWIKPLQGDKDIEWKAGTVVGSYQETPNALPEYSVRMAEKGFYHGVTGDCLWYRQPKSDPPAIKTDTTDISGLTQETSVLAEPKARSESAFESPTSVVDSLPPAIKHTLLSRTDPPPLANSSSAQSNAVEIVSSSSFSGSKRSSPSNEQVAEAKASTCDGANQNVPPPKKPKVADTHSHQESKSNRNSLISENFLQMSATPAGNAMAESSTKASLNAAIPRNPSPVTGSHQADPGQYGDYTQSQVPTMAPIKPAYEPIQPTRDVADYPPSVDSLEGNDCKLVIKVPSFAHPIAVREAIIGTGGKEHKRLLRETRSRRIVLKGHNMQPPCMQVEVITDPDNIDDAREIIEDAIISTVSVDERPRMLYNLAKENEYGASDGPARYQRSPRDSQEWIWLAVLETPPGFERLTGLFMDKNAKALKQIIAQSGVYLINLSNGLPKYIYIISNDPDMTNYAAKLVEGRIQWTMRNYGR